MEKYKFTMTRLLEPNGITADALKEEGAVGDMNYSFFNAAGHTTPEWKFFLGLDVDFFAGMASAMSRRSGKSRPPKTVVCIAGTKKVEPLRAALQRGLINVLITDAESSKALTAP